MPGYMSSTSIKASISTPLPGPSKSQFEVKVATVNTANIPGKAKRIISLNGKRTVNANGSRTMIRKAYVTLQEGHSLPFFNAVEEAEQKQEAVQEKVDKAAAKQADKTAKPSRRGFRLPKKSNEAKEESK